ncbi:MAG: ABC transporter permease [Acidimicrobiaceae bacterium]|nr:ABC transporter permease [Acidimicrobiaceae bacterium]MBO0747453.1 ABC transporter permease [Acidimicrobiaceae bacterium]
MLRYVVRRLFLAIPTLIIVSVLVFCLAQLLPGDVGRQVLGPYATSAQVAAFDQQHGFDRPLVIRYLHWLGGFVSGNWGTSVVQQEAVGHLLLVALGHSLQLSVFALALYVPTSIALGLLAAFRQGSAIDRAVTLGGTVVSSLPDFVVGVVLILVLAVGLGWFPVSALGAVGGDIATKLHALFLPALTLTLGLVGYVARMTRAGTITTLASPFVRTAVLKGLPRSRVVSAHVLRNSLLPTVTIVGTQIGYLVGGLVITETLYNYPGFGEAMLTAAQGHDVAVLETGTLLLAVISMGAVLATDLLYSALDPRVQRRV